MTDYLSQSSAIERRIGQRVRARRIELAMSQEALAECLGVTFQQVQKYEKGINRISASRLFEVAAALGVTVSYFFEGLSVGATPGVGASGAGDLIAQTMATPEGVQLVALFGTIQSPRVRKRVLELVRALADEDEPDGAADDMAYPKRG